MCAEAVRGGVRRFYNYGVSLNFIFIITVILVLFISIVCAIIIIIIISSSSISECDGNMCETQDFSQKI